MRHTIHCFTACALVAALTPLSATAATAETPMEEAGAPPILYQLPIAYGSSAGPIDLTVVVEGRKVHEERITLAGSTSSEESLLAGSPVFELLAGTPDRRTWLGHLAAKDPGIEFRIAIEAQDIERLGWEELQSRAAELDLDRLQPIRVEFVERQADSPVMPRQGLPNKARNLEECLEDCEDDYNACGTTQACQDDFITCASRCGFTGACTPTTTESSVLTPLGFQFAGEYACTDYFSLQFWEYVLYGDKYRRTTTSVHTNFYCRQTTTVEVDYVWYNQCWQLYTYQCLPGTPIYSFPPFSPYLCN